MFKCPKCGMEYDRDLNASINIAHRVISSMGDVSLPNQQMRRGRRKATLNAGSPQASAVGSSQALHRWFRVVRNV